MDVPFGDMVPALAASAIALAIMVWVWTRIPTHPYFKPARVAITLAVVLAVATVAWMTCFSQHGHGLAAHAGVAKSRPLSHP